MSRDRPKRWLSAHPEKCDICNDPITNVFVDGKTDFGCWANMCLSCHLEHGFGLGTGRGQAYEKVNGEFLKMGG